jgi:hypothetical protein
MIVWTIAALGLAIIVVLIWTSALAGFFGERLPVSVLIGISKLSRWWLS